MTEDKKQKMIYEIELGDHIVGRRAGGWTHCFICYPEDGEAIDDALFSWEDQPFFCNDNGDILDIDEYHPEDAQESYGWSDKELDENQKLLNKLCDAYYDATGAVEEAMKILEDADMAYLMDAVPYVEGHDDEYKKRFGDLEWDRVEDLTDD